MNWRNGPGSRGNPGNPRVFEPDATHLMRDDFTERAARHVARRDAPVGSQPVLPYEMRTGPWSGYNQLGIEAAFAADSNNSQTILKLDEWGMPADWTIALGMDFGDVDSGGFDVTAQISFGSGGAMQVVEIDWLNGASITVPMNAVNVVALYNLQDLEAAPNVPADLRLRVTLARGSKPQRATRSLSFTSGTGVDLINIPKFARDLLVIPNFSDAAFYTANGIVFNPATGSGGVALHTIQMSQMLHFLNVTGPVIGAFKPVPLPPFARSVQTVTYPAGAPVSLQCVLQFGIGL